MIADKDTYVHHLRIKKMLSANECAQAVGMAGEFIEYRDGPDDNLVHQQLYDLDEMDHTALYERMWKMCDNANRAIWRMRLTGWQQPLRIARYLPGYRHDWHCDYTATDTSKLAFSIPLNSGYTGGKFELIDYPPIPANRGDAIIFPAFLGHRVTPVESGVRYVLLGWLTGPRFV